MIELALTLSVSTSHTVTTKNKVNVWQLLNVQKKSLVKKLVSFLIQKDQKSVQKLFEGDVQRVLLHKLVKKSVLQLNKESNQLVK